MTSISIIVLDGKNQAIGAIEKLTIRDDGNNPKLEISRMRLDKTRLSEAFARGSFQVAFQRYPMHIVVLEDNKETIRATNVWITGIAAAYNTGEWMLSEGIEADCERVSGTKTHQSSDGDSSSLDQSR